MRQTECLAAQLGQQLLARGEWLATAESCTGGLIGAALTDIAGSSQWFGFGYITYSNQAKQHLLGVAAETLAQEGAVSERTVREMAEGARTRSGADWSIAVSGIAGPGGGTADKPVGTVWFAIAGPDGFSEAMVRQFNGGRAEVRAQTVETALKRLTQLLEQPLSA